MARAAMKREATEMKQGASLAGIALATLGLPILLWSLRIIGGAFKYILAASGLAFVLGFLGYAKYKKSVEE